MKIAKESWVIMAIGLADLVTTIVFIQHHGAEEANPLFRHYWEMGLAAFVCAKFALLIGPLGVLEWARQHRPRLVSWALRGAIVAYVIMYGVGYVHLNRSRSENVDLSDLYSGPPPMADRMMGRLHPHLHSAAASSTGTKSDDKAISVTVY